MLFEGKTLVENMVTLAVERVSDDVDLYLFRRVCNTSIVQQTGRNNLVLLDFNSHKYFDYRNNALPVAMHFCYMYGNGNICESRYDLYKAVAHLKTRNDIIFTGDSDGGVVCNVPYYNAENGRRQQIDFIWAPSQSDYARIVKKADKNWKLTSSLFDACAELDILGLRAAGAVLGDN